MPDQATILLGFYRGRSWTSRLIEWQTRSVYSHVAGRLEPPDDLDSLDALDTLDWQRPVIEAWTQPFPRGGVFARRDWFEAHTPGTRVDVFEVPALGPRQAVQIWRAAQDIVGLNPRYDYRAVLRFLSRRDEPADGAWFCSELWAHLFAQAGCPLLARVPPAHVSPAMLSWSPRLRYAGSLIQPAPGVLTSYDDPHMRDPVPPPAGGPQALRTSPSSDADSAAAPATAKSASCKVGSGESYDSPGRARGGSPALVEGA